MLIILFLVILILIFVVLTKYNPKIKWNYLNNCYCLLYEVTVYEEKEDGGSNYSFELRSIPLSRWLNWFKSDEN